LKQKRAIKVSREIKRFPNLSVWKNKILYVYCIWSQVI
jgi:hypothetical protein